MTREEEEKLIEQAIADGKLRKYTFDYETKPYLFNFNKPRKVTKHADKTIRKREAKYRDIGLL